MMHAADGKGVECKTLLKRLNALPGQCSNIKDLACLGLVHPQALNSSTHVSASLYAFVQQVCPVWLTTE